MAADSAAGDAAPAARRLRSAGGARFPTTACSGTETFVFDGNVRDAGLCDVAGPCFEYPLTLAASGARLRVAIDTPSREDTFLDRGPRPDGTVVSSTTNSNQFNAEAFLADPAPGRYAVRVVPQSVEDASFRMRAKLERSLPAVPDGPGRDAPEPPGRAALRVRLRRPGHARTARTRPMPPTPRLGGGHDLYSCTQDEAAPVAAGGSGAVDCLRLTSGPMNVGPGPFDMRFTFIEDMADGTAEPAFLRGPIFQTIHFSDGSEETSGSRQLHLPHDPRALPRREHPHLRGIRRDSIRDGRRWRSSAPARSRGSAPPTSSSATGSPSTRPSEATSAKATRRPATASTRRTGSSGSPAGGATSTAGSGPASTWSSTARATACT